MPTLPLAEAASTIDLKTLIAAIIVLSGAIGKLFYLYYASTREVSKKLDACETRHQIRDKEFMEVRLTQARFEGQMIGMDKLVQQVINSVQEGRRNRVPKAKTARKRTEPATTK